MKQVGEVTNRRAWHNPDLVTREVLALYKRPLRVRGWDAALLATSRAAGNISHRHVAAQFAAVRELPALLVTGGWVQGVAVPTGVHVEACRMWCQGLCTSMLHVHTTTCHTYI